jgi:hypothetical protein
MQTYNFFFIIVLSTVVLTRLWLLLKPISSPRLKGFKLHHYMYGLVVVGISVIFSNITLYGIGFGLIVDEMPLFLTYKNNNYHWKEYNSLLSRLGVVFCLLLLYFFKKYLIFTSLL